MAARWWHQLIGRLCAVLEGVSPWNAETTEAALRDDPPAERRAVLQTRLNALTDALNRNTRQADANPGETGFLNYVPRRSGAEAGGQAPARPSESARAALFGWKPISSAMARIRSRVAADTPGWPLSANDTAALVTPARRAMSAMVGRFTRCLPAIAQASVTSGRTP